MKQMEYEMARSSIVVGAQNDSVYFSDTVNGRIVSVLSDVQELIAMGQPEKANELISTIKYTLFKEHEKAVGKAR
jgi:hypothetical protein